MKKNLMLLIALALLAFACEEEVITPENEIAAEESLIWSDKFDYDFGTPVTSFPQADDSLKNIYDVTLTGNSGTELTGILNIDAGNSFSDNFVNSAILTIGNQEFDLISKNVAIVNGLGQFRFTFGNAEGETITTTLTGTLGRSLSGGYSSNATGIPATGRINATSQGDPFRIDFDPDEIIIITFPQ